MDCLANLKDSLGGAVVQTPPYEYTSVGSVGADKAKVE
jgi:hypothetical protein